MQDTPKRPDVLRRRSSSRHPRSFRSKVNTQSTLYEDDRLYIWGLAGDGDQDFSVDFNGDRDETNPINWPSSRKWTIVAILSVGGLLGNLATMMCIPAVPQILEDFHSKNALYEVSLVSLWEVGEAIGPLFVAPLSEIFGRAMVYNLANLWFVVMALGSGASQNIGMLLAFRLLNGIGDSSQSLNAGIVGDMFVQDKRGLAVAITSFPPMLGPVAGPVIGGYLTSALGWRWSFWLCAILGGVYTVVFALFYRESYAPTILRDKAAALRRAGNEKYHSKFDFASGITRRELYLKGITRPLKMLTQLPVVSMLALYISIQFGLLYVVLATTTETMEDVYGFRQGTAGLSYLGVSVGMALGVLTCALTLDPLLKRQKQQKNSSKPEARLGPTLVGAVGMPIGILMYGWTAQAKVFWIAPLIGNGIVGFSFYLASVPLQAYLIDSYTIFAASAIAATVASRCICGALLPLAAPPLYQTLGLGEGNTVLAVVGIVFIPLPLYILKYGERLRRRYDRTLWR